MAFRQPTALPPRTSAPRASSPARPSPLAIANPSQHQSRLSDSQEWVLFSPSQVQHSPTISAQPEVRTVGASRLSDFGSLNTVGRTGTDADLLSEVLDDGSELDSLDDGLHAFREPNPYLSAQSSLPYFQPAPPSPRRWIDQSGGAILPAHDGLGTFLPSSGPAQDAMWNHERMNPHRRSIGGHYRSASSVHRRLQALDEEVPAEEAVLDDLRFERIQKWRLEQSRILAEEYGKEKSKDKQDEESQENNGALIKVTHAEDEEIGIWQRITRTVIRNLVGIDDHILAVILGEELVDERYGLAAVAEESSKCNGEAAEWETRLVRRIARELGQLVSNLTAPPRLSAPLETVSLDYAGIPIAPIPEEPRDTDAKATVALAAGSGDGQRDSAFPNGVFDTLGASDTPSAPFRPTLMPQGSSPKTPTVAEIEYWEQTPDLKSVFSYLARRFLSSRRATQHHLGHSAHSPDLASAALHGSSSTNIATSHTPASVHRANIINQQHPLLSRPSRRRRSIARYPTWHHHVPGAMSAAGLGVGMNGGTAATGPAAAGLTTSGSAYGVGSAGLGWYGIRPGSLKRAGTSCASVSTKRSRLEKSEAASRNYWDVGSGKDSEGGFAWMGVGGWGEV